MLSFGFNLLIFFCYCDVKSYKWLRIDGEVKASERQKIINTFNNDPSYSVFLLSTQVGGYGLNLTAADRVVICKNDVVFLVCY
jgi:DNA excision repair protein ERCC-6